MKIDKKTVLTIPNLLSLIRLLLIPLFVVLYLNGYEWHTAVVLALSGMTDMADGFIARRFGQISDIGKVLDPIADKLTQAAMLLCLMSKYEMLAISFAMLLVKEITAGFFGVIVILRTEIVPSAQWHGKLTTTLLYGMMIIHVIWQDIPAFMSNVLNVTCIIMMLISLVLYAVHHFAAIRTAKRDEA